MEGLKKKSKGSQVHSMCTALFRLNIAQESVDDKSEHRGYEGGKGKVDQSSHSLTKLNANCISLVMRYEVEFNECSRAVTPPVLSFEL